jgi:hypothetical protein
MSSLTATQRSIAITSLGIIFMTIAFDLGWFSHVPFYIRETIQLIGWMCMTTGFPVVLCSRLYIIIRNPQVPRILIIFVVLINSSLYIISIVSVHIPNIVLGYEIYKVSYRLEVIFAVQEFVLASLYIFFFARFFKDGNSEDAKHVKNVFLLLCGTEIIIVATDAILLTLVYTDLLTAKFTIHGFVYAIKLEIEFVVLNHLTQFGQRREGHLRDLEENSGLSSLDMQKEPSGQILVGGDPSSKKRDLSLGNSESPTGRNPYLSSGSGAITVDEEIQNERSNSMDEMERRYLGRVK